jgi:hypothetical protein
MKVKLFTDEKVDRIEDHVNKWLEEVGNSITISKMETCLSAGGIVIAVWYTVIY